VIIGRTPVRISFVGGGSDLPSYYRQQSGAVLSTAINKFIYVSINKKFDDRVRLSYSKTEEVSKVGQIEHKLVRASLELLEITGGVEITSIADVPSQGTGLGSSSAFTVALLHTLQAYKGRYATSKQLAKDACCVEIDMCGQPIGKQDHYAAAYGGFNIIEFFEDDSVKVSPIIFPEKKLQTLQGRLMMFYTGITRSASAILKKHSELTEKNPSNIKLLKKMVDLVYVMQAEIQLGVIDSFGEILHENWLLKKQLAKEVSSLEINHWYTKALKAGALGGKLLGAGGGGFLLFYVPEDYQIAVSQALSDLRYIPIQFEPFGSQIIFYSPNSE